MKYTQLIFGPAGKTKKVADAMREQRTQNVETADLTDPAVRFTQIRFQEGDLWKRII